ncbi:MAG: c-type cytochrome [Chitinophagaceae bacterium]|nr:MAG: c-type cytochrome [Chitinophagaceae bacterium]
MKLNFSLLTILMALLFIGCGPAPMKYEVSFESYKIADGFQIGLVASEPLIEAPVAIDFDDKGRVWVAEMRGFMRDLAGTDDDKPSGRISILIDSDNDGVAETSKVFLDSLVLPRGLAHAYGGLLYVEPPYLWFVEINNDKPGKKTLIDSSYAEGGSPEAQANGLMLSIDNWIYSANSQFRYRLKDGKWLRQPTTFRGQFGITRDDFGRLYYNYNTIQIAGDYVLPNTFIGNPYLKPKEAVNQVLTRNQRVYPLHATTVNRGYAEGVLDKDSMLINVTAACGPLVYRGGQFPEEYNLNAFMCEPQANLVKRNILSFKADHTIATQAWDDRDFIASTDEGFRPVNLHNGPDGAMYVVDMHRGTMEYRAFATQYYNNGLSAKKLDTLISAGRILRVMPKGSKYVKTPDMGALSATELVENLKSNNGWIRDRAQQLLIRKKDMSVIDALKKMAATDTNQISAIHAMYVLEGLDAINFSFLRQLAEAGRPMVTPHALQLLQRFTDGNADAMVELATTLAENNHPVVDLYLAALLGPWNKIQPSDFAPILAGLSQRYSDRVIYQEAVLSSINGTEAGFKSVYQKQTSESAQAVKETPLLDSLLKLAMKNRKEGKMNPIFEDTKRPLDARTNGLLLFRANCASCHGSGGEGIDHIGPPLLESEYVKGPTSRLAMILLYGLEGPIHVNGKLYKFNNTMPVFSNSLNDDQLVDVIKYLHNAFSNTPAKPITADKIKAMRGKNIGTLTEKNLVEMANADE